MSAHQKIEQFIEKRCQNPSVNANDRNMSIFKNVVAPSCVRSRIGIMGHAKYHCCFCQMKLGSRSAIIRHYDVKHPNRIPTNIFSDKKSLRCLPCGSLFSRHEHLRAHVRSAAHKQATQRHVSRVSTSIVAITTVEQEQEQLTTSVVLSPTALQSTPKRRAIALSYNSSALELFKQVVSPIVSPIQGNVMQVDGNVSVFNESGIDVRVEPMTPVINQVFMVHESSGVDVRSEPMTPVIETSIMVVEPSYIGEAPMMRYEPFNSNPFCRAFDPFHMYI